ncbi:hypothetical protein BgiBS90_020831 [Biomphalaria glabrata]|nr:hypothetical protein BgiBS90_020831 [Biomphalaria glabrata]
MKYTCSFKAFICWTFKLKRGEISDATWDDEPDEEGSIKHDEFDWSGGVNVDDSGRPIDVEKSSVPVYDTGRATDVHISSGVVDVDDWLRVTGVVDPNGNVDKDVLGRITDMDDSSGIGDSG